MNETFAQIVFYINSAIFACIVYYAFTRIFKPAVHSIFIWLALIVYSLISLQVFFEIGNMWANVLVTVGAFLVFALLFKGSLSTKLVFALLIYVTVMLADVIVFFSLSYIYYVQNGSEIPLEYLISIGRTIVNIIFFSMVFINILLFRKYIDKKAGYTNFKVPVGYTISTLVILAGIILISLLIVSMAVDEAQANITQVALAQFIVLAIVFLVVWQYNKMLTYLKAQEKNRRMEQMLKRWEIQYTGAENTRKAMAKMEHNLNQHFLAIMVLAKEGKVEGVKEYVEQKLGSISSVIDTGNISIDTMLNYYRQIISDRLGIDLKTKLLIPPNMTLDADLIAMILGNALENAIDACEHVEYSQLYIHIEAKVNKGKHLFFIVTNPYAVAPVTDKDGNLITVKSDQDNHGLGLASIREILPEEAGHIHTEYDGNIFKFMLLFYNVLEDETSNNTNKG